MLSSNAFEFVKSSLGCSNSHSELERLYLFSILLCFHSNFPHFSIRMRYNLRGFHRNTYFFLHILAHFCIYFYTFYTCVFLHFYQVSRIPQKIYYFEQEFSTMFSLIDSSQQEMQVVQ